MNTSPEKAIQDVVNREMRAWDDQDVDTLLDLFYQDMVWARPLTAYDHNPETWELELGHYDRER